MQNAKCKMQIRSEFISLKELTNVYLRLQHLHLKLPLNLYAASASRVGSVATFPHIHIYVTYVSLLFLCMSVGVALCVFHFAKCTSEQVPPLCAGFPPLATVFPCCGKCERFFFEAHSLGES